MVNVINIEKSLNVEEVYHKEDCSKEGQVHSYCVSDKFYLRHKEAE